MTSQLMLFHCYWLVTASWSTPHNTHLWWSRNKAHCGRGPGPREMCVGMKERRAGIQVIQITVIREINFFDPRLVVRRWIGKNKSVQMALLSLQFLEKMLHRASISVPRMTLLWSLFKYFHPNSSGYRKSLFCLKKQTPLTFESLLWACPHNRQLLVAAWYWIIHPCGWPRRVNVTSLSYQQIWEKYCWQVRQCRNKNPH